MEAGHCLVVAPRGGGAVLPAAEPTAEDEELAAGSSLWSQDPDTTPNALRMKHAQSQFEIDCKTIHKRNGPLF